MSKHYPGPWTVHVGDKGSGPWDRTTIEAGPEYGSGVVATVNVMIPTGEANARLIAAAPDLLNMLQQARTMLKAYGSDSDACHVALMDDINAAIAKATSTTSDLGRDAS